MDNDDALITARYKALEGVLDERQRRLYAAAEAKVLGHGGAKRVWHATGVRCTRINSSQVERTGTSATGAARARK